MQIYKKYCLHLCTDRFIKIIGKITAVEHIILKKNLYVILKTGLKNTNLI